MDVAAIEGARNAIDHSTLIVRPDSPGKSRNSASASFWVAKAGCACGLPTQASVTARPSQKTVPSERRLILTSIKVPTTSHDQPPSRLSRPRPTPTPTPLLQPPDWPPTPTLPGERRRSEDGTASCK